MSAMLPDANDDGVGPDSEEDIFEDIDFRFLLSVSQDELQSGPRLFSHIEQAHWYYEDYLADANPNLPRYPKLKDFGVKAFQMCDSIRNLGLDVNRMWNEYHGYKSSILVCGVVALTSDMTQVLLVRNFNGTAWTFPKGKINEGEKPTDCAIREAYEETGYDCSDIFNGENPVLLKKEKKQTMLYVVSGFPRDYDYGPRVRKEVSNIKFFSIKRLQSIDNIPDHKDKAKKLFGQVLCNINSWNSVINKMKSAKRALQDKREKRILNHDRIMGAMHQALAMR